MVAIVILMVMLLVLLSVKPWRYERDPQQRLFGRFERLLARHGVIRLKGEVARAFATRAAQWLPGQAESLMAFVELYERQRYAAQSSDTAMLRASLARLRGQLPWRPARLIAAHTERE